MFKLGLSSKIKLKVILNELAIFQLKYYSNEETDE